MLVVETTGNVNGVEHHINELGYSVAIWHCAVNHFSYLADGIIDEVNPPVSGLGIGECEDTHVHRLDCRLGEG